MRVPGHVEVDARGLDPVRALVRLDVPSPAQAHRKHLTCTSSTAQMLPGCRRDWSWHASLPEYAELHSDFAFMISLLRTSNHLRQVLVCRLSGSMVRPAGTVHGGCSAEWRCSSCVSILMTSSGQKDAEVSRT